MKVLKSEHIRQLDKATIREEDIHSVDLMERAGSSLTSAFTSLYGSDRSVIIVCGPGNNGGDGLVMARLLNEADYEVTIWELDLGKKSPDHQSNLDRISGIPIIHLAPNQDLPRIRAKDRVVFIDAIFGSGLSRPIEQPLAQLVNSINDAGCDIVSIDMPSGLKDDEAPKGAVIKATYTFVIQVPRYNLFLSSCQLYVGEWFLIDIGLSLSALNEIETDIFYVDEDLLSGLDISPRPSFSHKGSFGHALIVCGSHGMMGASLLATEACLRSGPGKVTSHVPRVGRDITHMQCPEALVSVDDHDFHISYAPFENNYDAIGLGCGLGKSTGTSELIHKVLVEKTRNLVIDADALNIISMKGWLDLVPTGSILTPHPGEFKRLAGDNTLSDRAMIEKQRKMAAQHQIIVVLKGHFTSIALPDGNIIFNGSGNPGMATGGSGDVLTGIITGLLAQYQDPAKATILGVYIHGLAGDLALECHSYESLLARDIIQYLGEAFKEISYR